MKYKAIIWDCDGVLIDSEALACGSEAEAFGKLGYKISTEDFIDRFMGKNSKQLFQEIEQDSGLRLEEAFQRSGAAERIKELFNSSLKAIPGIAETLNSFSVPMAVASGSSPARLAHSLTLTSLFSYFKEHIYSSEQVKNGKPAPDVFLYAAQKLGVAPQECLVIEDGIHGIAAAKAAGMDVYAYVGGSHMTEKLRQKVADTRPNKIFSDMRALPALLASAPEQKAGNAS
jgi:HAD superfamily hydrolase (TIGR01509 family)